MSVDARDWLDALNAAWRAERTAVRARFALERSGRMLSERVALGLALAPLRIVDEQSAPGDRVRVQVAAPEALDLDNLRISPGDPVRLWSQHPDAFAAVIMATAWTTGTRTAMPRLACMSAPAAAWPVSRSAARQSPR